MYDVAIIGAGPAGLMAAKTAAEKGLKVVLVEQKKDVSHITRACCEQLIMDENFQGETVRFTDGQWVFTKNGFTIPYDGPVLNVIDKYFISPAGRTIHFAYPDKRPIVIKFDKGLLLQGLWEQCEKAGVAMMPSTIAGSADDQKERVKLSLVSSGKESSIDARKLIIGEGANAQRAGRLGINRERMHIMTALVVEYMVTGFKDYERSALKTYFGRSYGVTAPLPTGPTLLGDDVAYFVVGGSSKNPPAKIFEYITQKGTLAPLLRQARVVKKVGCTVKAFTPLKVPYLQNTLVIGDAAAYVEVETQGALTCGFRAGHAVVRECSGEPGFEEYTRWWQDSFEFNGEDFMQVARGFALVPTYTDDELDYLFGLIENETLEGTYNQYKTPRLMWDAILSHRERIQRENQELYNKIISMNMTLRDML